MRTIYRPVVQLDCCTIISDPVYAGSEDPISFMSDVIKYQNIMNLHPLNGDFFQYANSLDPDSYVN